MTGSNVASGDSVILATAGYDHTIRFWQPQTGICHKTLQHPDSQVNALAITPDRTSIAAAGYQHVRIYDINSANVNPLISYDNIPKNCTAVGFQEDGRWMYAGSEDGCTRIWDLRSKTIQRTHMAKGPVNCVCLHPNQGELFIGDQSGTITIYNLKTDSSDRLVPEDNAAIQSIAIDADCMYAAAVTSKGKCHVWTPKEDANSELTKLKPRTQLEAAKGGKYALKCQFSPDSTLLATTSADATARIWRTVDFKLMTELKENNQRWVWDCAFSDDSQYLVTASSDNMARLWHVDTGEIRREYSGHQKALTCLAFKDGQV